MIRFNFRKETIFVILTLCFALCFLIGWLYFDIYIPAPTPLQITVNDLSLCQLDQGEWVINKVNETNDPSFICAEIETDTSPIQLTLMIEKADNLWMPAEYSALKEFDDGFIFFSIRDQVSPGRYLARIMFGRLTLAQMYIMVTK